MDYRYKPKTSGGGLRKEAKKFLRKLKNQVRNALKFLGEFKWKKWMR